MEPGAPAADAPKRRFRDEARAFALDARPHLLPFVILGFVILVLYDAALKWLLNAWSYNEYYGHGYLVPFLALFFMWRARPSILDEPTEALSVWSFTGIAAALVLYLIGYAEHEPFYFGLSLVAAIMGTFIYTLGARRARHLFFPLALLVLAIPLPEIGYIGARLQQFASWGTEGFLGLFGLDVVRENFILTVGDLSWEVAPLCGGLSSAISILTIAVALAAYLPMRGWQRAVVVMVAIPLAMLGNVLRISLVVAVGLTWGQDASTGFFHGFSDIILFGLVVGLVASLALLFARLSRRTRA